MTAILFQRCDGQKAGDGIITPRGRRRLSTLVRRHADRSRPHIVSVHRKGQPLAVTDFSVRMRKEWRHTTVGPHDTVIIVYAAGGGGRSASGRGRGSGKATGASIGLLVGAIALAALGQFWAIGAVASGLGVSTATAGTIWAAGSAALLAGAGYLLSKATQAKANKEAENRPVYGVSGGGNLPRSGDRIPVVYGRCWNTPDLSQPDYAVYDGDDQILYKRLTIGCGKYAIKSIRVSGITMWTDSGGLTPPFTGANFEIIQPGGTSSLVPGAVATVQAVASNELPRVTDFPNWAGPFDFGVDAPNQSRIQLDFSLPQGVYAVPQSGKFQGQQFPTDWGVLFEYAPCDEDGNVTGSWSTLWSEGGNTLTTRPMRFTRFVDIPSGRYTFRGRNTGAAAEVEHPSGFTADITNTVMWEGLRSHIPETIVRPGVTELAMVIRSGKALSVTSFAEIEVESSRILPVWYGSSTGWIEEESDKCVWAAADILRNQLHGAGIADSAIDLNRLKHYFDTLTDYDSFSGVIRGPVSVYEALSTVLGTMRASPLRLGSIWTIVRDEAKSVRKHVISRRQILRDSSAQEFTLDLSDGSADVIVEWLAGGDPKRRREKRVTFGTLTTTPRRMAATGVTDAAHAIHLATWAAATAYYRRERRSVSTELAGRLLKPNDSASIDSWYFDALQTGGILARDGYRIEIDSDLELPASPYAILRAPDGKEWGPIAVTRDGSGLILNADDVAQAFLLTGLTLDEVLNTATQAFTTIVIGTLTTVQDAWLIRSIRFSGPTRIDVEAVYDAPEVWSALGESITPPPPPPSSGLETPDSLIIPYVRATAVQKNGAMFMDWTCGRVRQAAAYVVLISYDNWATSETAHYGEASSGSYPLREYTGIIYVRAYVISQAGTRSTIVSTQFSVKPAVLNLENAIHGSLRLEAFTDGIEPVGLTDGLPDPVGYTGPKFVANLEGDTLQLYKYENGEFVRAINTDDLVGVITETQISDDAISTPKLKANSVTTAKVAAGAITADQIAANAVVAAKIQAGAVSADKINVTKLDAISADMGSILAGSLNINNRFIVASNGVVTISNAATGARLVITSSVIEVYDASNVLRVRLGIW
jgi:predicted phage tail protein